MKVVILLCALSVSALAAPKYTRPTRLDPKLAPQVQAAEQAWVAAEAEPDVKKQADLFERAALAFGDIDAAPVDAKVTAQRALAELAAAAAEFERRSGQPDDPAARYHYAQAKLAVADAELEAYLAIALPRGLDFDPGRKDLREASLKRFSAWIDEKRTRGSSATRLYEAVLSIRDAASSITAAARLGTISQAFANEVTGSPAPRGSEETRAAYCSVASAVAAPLEERAAEAFAVCLAKSTELGWFAESSAECERQLFVLKPDEFPRASELRSKPAHVAPVIVLEPAAR